MATIQSQLLTNPDSETAALEHLERGIWQTLIKAEQKFYRQKSRVQWNNLGDKDTSFYHKTVVQRATRNHIHFLKDSEDRLIGEAEGIKIHAAEYFTGIMGATDMSSSPVSLEQLQDLMPFRCTEAQALELQKDITTEEITKTVFALPLDKCPGPDGYSVEFLRSAWTVVGNDIIVGVQEFFRNGRLLKDLNNTAIALIPKNPQACHL